MRILTTYAGAVPVDFSRAAAFPAQLLFDIIVDVRVPRLERPIL
jgi:hypothetical protein